ncbi:hypothetical protein C8034_v002467 [Colletotrichum sidae]|uniref:Uncharacterized protein n=1 Tax=Colletotrichum sidae TaxID=1347389 RepID=A0A4R8TCG2_9PEZI|nr:hypothetical protein C8034_v002467 [Colletotrichum sidae]
MSNPTSSTPVKVPASAANNSQATQDHELRSNINYHLLKDGHVTKIQEQLLHSLHANQANWPTQIQNHALSLLRSGEVSSFPALLRRVLDDVRQDTLNPPTSTTAASTTKTNGATAGDKDKKANGASSNSTPAPSAAADSGATPNLAIPAAVVEEAIKVTRASLDALCEIDPKDAS